MPPLRVAQTLLKNPCFFWRKNSYRAILLNGMVWLHGMSANILEAVV